MVYFSMMTAYTAVYLFYVSTSFDSNNINDICFVFVSFFSLRELYTVHSICGFHVAQPLVCCAMFARIYLSFDTFSYSHCILCFSIYGFWLSLWYPQTFLHAIHHGVYTFVIPTKTSAVSMDSPSLAHCCAS